MSGTTGDIDGTIPLWEVPLEDAVSYEQTAANQDAVIAGLCKDLSKCTSLGNGRSDPHGEYVEVIEDDETTYIRHGVRGVKHHTDYVLLAAGPDSNDTEPNVTKNLYLLDLDDFGKPIFVPFQIGWDACNMRDSLIVALNAAIDGTISRSQI